MWSKEGEEKKMPDGRNSKSSNETKEPLSMLVACP
jgi:hypothetical protein